ncbi:MAG: DUF4260 domain-containing protein [Chloroflexi bacterium]|nr:DUF4260 domain-containing protein [Chloroflexota bacterium]
MPSILLRLEGTAVLVAAILFYFQQGFNGWTFALLLLWPDIAIVAYAINKKVGMIIYNILHTYSLPVVLLVLSLAFGWTFGLQFTLIWLAHIGMDRLVGYGLKYTDDFKSTHLGRV